MEWVEGSRDFLGWRNQGGEWACGEKRVEYLTSDWWVSVQWILDYQSDVILSSQV